MTDAVLALNPGSSSLKAVLRSDAGATRLVVERLGTPDASLLDADGERRPLPGAEVAAAVAAVLEEVRALGASPVAVAHRVVHGGPERSGPARVDDALLAELERLVPLAPLHLPSGLRAMAAARAALPEALHTASFDTAFWRALPEEARRLPVPDDVAALGVQRYGFHGLSVEHVLDVVGRAGRTVVAHLGSGCSVSAVADGAPVHTTMSFTPTSGVPSGTRSGDLDPQIVLHLLQAGWSVDRVRRALDSRSGLTGPSGGTADVRDLLAARDHDARAALALDVLVRSVAMAVAACTTVLGGLDTLVLTGGTGEHAGPVRAEICARLRHLGVELDPRAGAPGRLDAAGSAVQVLVVPADEELVLDRQARSLLAG